LKYAGSPQILANTPLLPQIKDLVSPETQLKEMILNNKLLKINRDANKPRYFTKKSNMEGPQIVPVL
jgi:hypothetical protein